MEDVHTKVTTVHGAAKSVALKISGNISQTTGILNKILHTQNYKILFNYILYYILFNYL